MIQSVVLNRLATEYKSMIEEVLINDTIALNKSQFSINTVTDSQYEINFMILKSETDTITNIKLRDISSVVLSNETVNIAISSDAQVIKYLFNFSTT